MDYERVYRQFIFSRRKREPALVDSCDYIENHHILPRSLGGSDEPSNLIALTAEDHFFAHLLLAKIHGGRMWGAVFLMSGRRRWNKESYSQLRAMYGAARRIWVEYAKTIPGKKGKENGHYNHATHDWVNLDTGERRKATVWEMWDSEGGARAGWTSVASGNRQTLKGWTTDESRIKVRGMKGKKFSFVNRDGRTFLGTQGEFAAKFGLSVASAHRVACQKSVTKCGWRLEGVDDRNHFCRKRGGTPAARDSGSTITLVAEDGTVISGKRRKIAVALGKTENQVSAAISYLRQKPGRTYLGHSLATD